MKIVGITGGIGSGKTTVCQIFETLNTSIYQADERAKYLMANDTKLKSEIIKAFGEGSYSNNELNKDFLAKAVFSDSKKTQLINSLVHPAVGKDFAYWAKKQEGTYILKEAALMIESGSYKNLDYMINVFAPLETRIARIKKRDPQRSEDQILSIIDKQVSDEKRMELSDFNIDNGGAKLVIPQVLKINKILVSS